MTKPESTRLPLLATACIAAALASGCQTMQPWLEQANCMFGRCAQPEEEPVRTEAGCIVSALGEFHRATLSQNGSASPCYAIRLASDGTLRIDGYAPREHPDVRVEVRDDRDQRRASGVWQTPSRPTVVREWLDAGAYSIRLAALAPNPDAIEYDLRVVFEEGRRAPLPPAPVPPSPSQGAAPVRPPEPAEATDALEETAGDDSACDVSTFVAFLEKGAGSGRVAVLAAGGDEGLKVGSRGTLRRDGAVVGEVEVIELLASGSRARLTGRSQAEITEAAIDSLDVCLRVE